MKRDKYLYWGFTGLMCIIFTFSALMYLFSYEVAEGYFVRLSFPTWMVYPSAIVKLLGVTAILSKKSALLKEWAYAGFFFDAVMAFTAHTIAGDGEGGIAALAILAVVLSRFFESRVVH